MRNLLLFGMGFYRIRYYQWLADQGNDYRLRICGIPNKNHSC
jgi:hypothetical protein